MVFHFFPLLAPELRRQVWEWALLRPSTVVRTWNNDKFSFGLRRAIPPVLQACTETRAWFIQRSHKRSQNTPQYDRIRQRQEEEGYIYIDWTRDIVYLHRECEYSDLMSDFQFSQLEQLQHLRMSWGVRPCWRRGSIHRGVSLIRRFRSLRTVTLEVKCLCSTAETVSDALVLHELRAIRRIVLAEFELEGQRDPSWQAPQLRVLQVTQFTICQN
ncbi:hypothetical protein F5883DRAFT_418782 [Diaporthe sp. PMI_573]|nr:hypothetical protein F5883DRAFT_418782 [Diaporthaceae sp. PMI_573]